MSTKTTNLELIKPELTDAADITAMNENWDKIDEEISNRVPSAAKLCSQSADNLTVPLAIIELSTELNPELYKIFNNPTAWIHTIFQDEVSTENKRMQIAVSHFVKNGGCKMAYRIYSNGGWGLWLEVAREPIVYVKEDVAKAVVPISIVYNNTENRYFSSNGLSELELVNDDLSEFETYSTFHISIIFNSGSTATTVTNHAGIYFTGDDCDDGVLTPVANKVYELGIWWNGLSFQCVVRGV